MIEKKMNNEVLSIGLDISFEQEIESVLHEDETVSSFILGAIKSEVEYRKVQNDFLANAIASRNEARETGVYFTHEEVMGELREMLEHSKQERNK